MERITWLSRFSCVFLSVLFGAACTSAGSAPPASTISEEPTYIDAYKIGIGDQLVVDVYRQADLSASVTVRPDGKITVPVVGDVFVGSKTPEEVGALITQELATYIRDPLVTVTVNSSGTEYESRIRVTGAVAAPQTTPFRTGMTVLDVILESGGVTEFAAPSRTTIYRAGEQIRVRLDRILKSGDLSNNYPLKPGDIITVPERIF